MKRRTIVLTIVGVIAAVAMMAYGSSRAAKKQPPDLDEARGIAEGMLTAWSDGDYAAFSDPFTLSLISDLDETVFDAWRSEEIQSTGAFVRIIEGQETEASGEGSHRFVFHAEFELDPSVQFAIVFPPGSHSVSRVALKPDK